MLRGPSTQNLFFNVTAPAPTSLVYGIVDARSASGVHGNPAEHEDILSVVLPAKKFVERVRSGEINDLKTLVAGYWFAQRYTAGALEH